MTKVRCWPGAVCRIDRDLPSASENIGALIVVSTVDRTPNDLGYEGTWWKWERSSRPLVNVCLMTGRVKGRISNSHEGGAYSLFPDAWLTPITSPPGAVNDEEVRRLYSPVDELSNDDAELLREALKQWAEEQR